MGDRSNLLNILSSFAGGYLDMRTDDFKKNIITGLSAGFSRVLAVLVMAMLLVVVLAVFAFGFIMLLGDAIGSWSGAAFIVGGVFLIGLAVLFFLRKKLFLGMFTNLFSGIMDTGTPTDSWKSLLLVLVRSIRDTIG